MTIKNVLLVGATGLVGSKILEALKASPTNFNTTLLVRPNSTSKQPEGFPILRHELTHAALVDALTGQDAVVTALSCDAVLGQIALIDAAVAAGVKHFIPTEYASNTLNPIVENLISWYQDKKTVHDHLVKVSKEHPGFKYTDIISGPFFSWGIYDGFLGYDIATSTARIYDGGELRVSYSEVSQVGLAVARALERGVTGYLRISSLTTTQNQIVEALERISGEKWTREDHTTHEGFEISAKMKESTDEKERESWWEVRAMRWVYGADCEGDWGVGDNEKLGLETVKEGGDMDGLVKLALTGEYN